MAAHFCACACFAPAGADRSSLLERRSDVFGFGGAAEYRRHDVRRRGRSQAAGIVSAYAAISRYSGPYEIAAVRIALIVIVALTGIAVGELAVLLARDPRARIAGVLYLLASATGFPDNVQAANTELILNLPLTLAACAAVAAASSAVAGVAFIMAGAAGALTGVAALFKYQAAIAGGAWLWAAYVARPARARVGGNGGWSCARVRLDRASWCCGTTRLRITWTHLFFGDGGITFRISRRCRSAGNWRGRSCGRRRSHSGGRHSSCWRQGVVAWTSRSSGSLR